MSGPWAEGPVFSLADVRAAAAALAEHPPGALGLGGQFSQVARQHPDRMALVTGEGRWTFGELDQRTNQIGRVLAAIGAVPGARVAVCLPNRAAFIETVLGAWKIGAIPVPVSHRAPAAERDALLALAAPAVTVVDAPEHPPTEGSVVELQDLAKAAAEESAGTLPDIETKPWKIVPTGGSTGRPKLVVVDRSLMHPAVLARTCGQREGGVTLIAGPLYHNGPFTWGTLQILAGGTLVLLERFDAAEVLDTIARERVSWTFLVPTMLHRIVDLPAESVAAADLSSLEVVLHSAAPCPPWLKRRVIALFGEYRLWELYGASEAGCCMIRGDEWLAHPGSVGRPAESGYAVRIVDDEGREQPAGEVGEIFVRPPSGPTFRYIGATERLVDGWVSVGDLGWLDREGYLYISDRRADLIISGGANVYPAEVEATLLEHPGVADVAVVGLPDPNWGQRVHAIVQPEGAAVPSAEALDGLARRRLAPEKRPKSYEFVERLPRDPSGKIRRARLRDDRMPNA